MSLLVHELLIGTGGGGPGNKSTASSVSLTPVSVTRPHSTVQVTHLQQRVVTINGNNSRLSTNDKGSKLADALAGIPPYSYSTNLSNHIGKSNPPRRAISHLLYNAPVSANEGIQSIKTISTPKTYVLPFVLQDHNYGAPPPATPPHSPQPTPISIPPSLSNSAIPQVNTSTFPHQSYRVHQILPANNLTLNSKVKPPQSISDKVVTIPKVYTKCSPDGDMVSASVNKVGFVHVSTNSNGDTGIHHSPIVPHMMSMPAHRQQFMPNPKPIYPSPYIPPPPTMSDSLMAQASGSSLIAGHDTDDESRVSERSSSVGPSGEETETAPELEEEEVVQSDDSITRCICNFTHDDGYMIQCDRCFVWQHVDCMEIDRNNIPDEYLCEACKPRLTDKNKARSLQIRRRQQIRAHLARLSSSDSEDNNVSTKSTKAIVKSYERKVLKKKKIKPVREVKQRRQSTSASSAKNSNVPTISLSKFNVNSDFRDSKINKRRRQSSSNSAVSQDMSIESSSNSLVTMEQIRAWIEDYEVAVTNHYSPELRAKVHAARINGISAEFRESTQAAMLGHRCRVAPRYDLSDGPDDKILTAATRLKTGTAIIEYQGKYTLKSQWGNVQIPPNLSYLPFVLQYNMQKEGLNICVDARTYGNDARFARRSPDANAEIQHVVERGSVHLYIVACKDIEEEEEITLSLTTAVCLRSIPTKLPTNCPSAQSNLSSKVEITSVKPKEEPTKNCVSSIRKNGSLSSKKNLKKSHLSLSFPQPLIRSSRRSTLTEVNHTNEVKSSPISLPSASPTKERRSSACTAYKSPSKVPPLQKPNHKSPNKICTSSEDLSSAESSYQDSMNEEALDSHKMTREERKIAAYMKAFERMEKAAQKRRGNEKRKEDRGRKNSQCEDEEDSKVSSTKEERTDRKGRKCAKGSPRKQSTYDNYDEDKSEDSSEGERSKNFEGCAGYSSPPYSGIPVAGAFRFPKTKKSLMNEWLNETVDPVLHTPSSGSDGTSGVPTCYMRSPATSVRKPYLPNPSNVSTEVDSRSAKKRWLRQAIIDGSEPPQSLGGYFICSSPNSRPDSPTGIDYITPLKKRRLARESMSSEQSNTPPSTPYHNSFEEKYNEEMELDHSMDESPDEENGIKDVKPCEAHEKQSINHSSTKMNEKDIKPDIKEKLEVGLDVKHESSISETSTEPLTVKTESSKVCPDSSLYCAKSFKKGKVSFSRKKVSFKKDTNNQRVKKRAKKRRFKKNLETGNLKGDSLVNNCFEKDEKQGANEVKDDILQSKLQNDCKMIEANSEDVVKESVVKTEMKSESTKEEGGDTVTSNCLVETSTGLDSRSSSIPLTPPPAIKNELSFVEGDNTVSQDDEEKPEKCEVANELPKPALVKKKLSILEYRKRKSVSSESDVREECLVARNATSSFASSACEEDVPSCPNASQDAQSASEDDAKQRNSFPSVSLSSEGFTCQEDAKPFPPPPIVPLPDKGVLSEVGFKLAEMDGDRAVKWNEAPTLLEQQRETLTERLRKEFGLRINGDKNKLRLCITEKWRNMGKVFSSAPDEAKGDSASTAQSRISSRICNEKVESSFDIPVSPSYTPPPDVNLESPSSQSPSSSRTPLDDHPSSIGLPSDDPSVSAVPLTTAEGESCGKTLNDKNTSVPASVAVENSSEDCRATASDVVIECAVSTHSNSLEDSEK